MAEIGETLQILGQLAQNIPAKLAQLQLAKLEREDAQQAHEYRTAQINHFKQTAPLELAALRQKIDEGTASANERKSGAKLQGMLRQIQEMTAGKEINRLSTQGPPTFAEDITSRAKRNGTTVEMQAILDQSQNSGDVLTGIEGLAQGKLRPLAGRTAKMPDLIGRTMKTFDAKTKDYNTRRDRLVKAQVESAWSPEGSAEAKRLLDMFDATNPPPTLDDIFEERTRPEADALGLDLDSLRSGVGLADEPTGTTGSITPQRGFTPPPTNADDATIAAFLKGYISDWGNPNLTDADRAEIIAAYRKDPKSILPEPVN